MSENPVVGPRASVFSTGKDGEAGDIGVYRRYSRTQSSRKTSRSKPDRILRQAPGSLLILIVAFVCGCGGSNLRACQHGSKSESVPTKSDLTSANLTTAPTPAYKRLMAIEFNTPKLNPKDQVYIASLDIPSEYKRLFVETQYRLNDVIGGYMNFNQIIYRKSGSNVDAQPVFDRLIAIKYSGYEDGYGTCLDWRHALRESVGV